MPTFEQHLRACVLRKEELDVFLSPDEPSWAQFDPEVGYILGNFMPRDGIDDSLTISTVSPNGARRSTVYADRPCRINTYGNSFTQCHQVSDHETWQEYLAAHLGEPIRNFGMGGFGAYQSYRRMLHVEATDDAVEHLVFYIWGDDHIRSVLRCRHALTMDWHRQTRHMQGRMFHGNFWANIEMDINSGELTERDNKLSTPESLYNMTDPHFMVEALHDDIMLEICLFWSGEIDQLDITRTNQLAEFLGHPPINDTDSETLVVQTASLRDAYAFAATRHVIEKAEHFATEHGKKLLFVLYCPSAAQQLADTGKRYDQPIVDYLDERGSAYFDMNLVHIDDHKNFNMPFDQYMNRYRHGHYKPAGNHFFAYAIKNTIVDWLDPKPITYSDGDQARISFEAGYLQNPNSQTE